MIYNYILEKFEYGEPIFFSELPGKSKDYLRQQIKKLVDILFTIYNYIRD